MTPHNNSSAIPIRLSLMQAIGSSVALFSLILALCIGSWSASGISVLLPRASAERLIVRRAVPANVNAENLAQVLSQRSVLLKRSVVLTLTSESGARIAVWTGALADHPSWVAFEVNPYSSGQAVVSTEHVRQYLISYSLEHVTKPVSCRIAGEWTDSKGVIRAQGDCIAGDGFTYDEDELSLLIKHALESGTPAISYGLTAVKGTVVVAEGSGVLMDSPLGLLATGRSNFKGSGEGRKANVRKGLHDRVNNVIVPTGATFSFNDTLGSVTVKNGWRMALTIFNGKDLVMAPGGGICQVSSTVFRAALLAGFPILEHRSHSLYVHYYEQYGVGLDATVFPGHQNLTFLNDTPGPLLLQSYSRGDDAFVQVYGTDDHRSVVMSGPYFAGTAPKDLLVRGKTLRGNDIAWQRAVTLSSGEQRSEIFGAHYLELPKSLSKKFQPQITQVRGMPTVATTKTVAEAR